MSYELSGPSQAARPHEAIEDSKRMTEKQFNVDVKGTNETSPDSPNDNGVGEVVIVDESGNKDIIRESDYTPEEYKKLKKKIDRYLLPLMWFCYGIQQTDKTAISTQAIFGLREDTNLVGQQYSWLTTIFVSVVQSGLSTMRPLIPGPSVHYLSLRRVPVQFLAAALGSWEVVGHLHALLG